MKRTLRLVGVAAMVLLLAASCKKDEKNNGETQRMTFTAGIEQGNSKTGLTPNGSHAFNQVWSEGDAINVNGTTFGLKNGANTDCAEFDGEVIPAETYYAVYPATATLNSSEVTFNLPASQTYLENSYASNLAPMAAKSTDENLSFANLCGLMELGLVGENITVTSLELSCDKPICGQTAEYTIGGDAALAMPAEAGKTITMNFTDGVQLNKTDATSFIFVLPPVTEGDFSLKVTYVAGANTIQKTIALPENISITASQVAYNTTSYELVGVNGTVTTGEATDVTSSGASVAYTVTPNGVSQARLHGVCCGTSENPTISGTHTEATGTTYTASFTGLAANTTYYVRAYAIFEPAAKNEGDVVVYGGQQSFETEAGSSAPEGFVDFGTHVGGVPTGKPLYWAKCNVGAGGDVTNKGYYIMWGYADDCSSKMCQWYGYEKGEYKYNRGDADQFTKYMSLQSMCYSGYSPDNKTVLDLTIDDAAYAENHSNRTPSKAEMEELLSVSYIKSVTSYNGKSVTGYIVYKAKHDSDKGKMDGTPHETYTTADTHIFIPSTGFRYETTSNSRVSAYLWSSTRFPQEQWAYELSLNSTNGTHKIDNSGRFYGFCVRPVREGN